MLRREGVDDKTSLPAGSRWECHVGGSTQKLDSELESVGSDLADLCVVESHAQAPPHSTASSAVL